MTSQGLLLWCSYRKDAMPRGELFTCWIERSKCMCVLVEAILALPLSAQAFDSSLQLGFRNALAFTCQVPVDHVVITSLHLTHLIMISFRVGVRSHSRAHCLPTLTHIHGFSWPGSTRPARGR